MNVLSIDIGGTNFRCGIVNEENQLLKFEKVSEKEVFTSENILKDLADHLKHFMEGMDVEACAIGFPGTLDASRSFVIQAPNIPFMENLPVKQVLEEELKMPVLAERDVTFALCFDMKKYRIDPQKLVSGIYFGTGIGNALFVNGKPLVGRHGTAGELGHIPVLGDTTPCGCGNVGCLEAIAGGKALVKLQQEFWPETPIGDVFQMHAMEKPLDRFIDGMAIAVATETNILDPDMVLVGGGVLNMPGFPKEYLRERILAHVRKPFPYEDLPLVFTEDEKDKSVIGGAIFARQMLH